MHVCLHQAIKSFQNNRCVATAFYPALVTRLVPFNGKELEKDWGITKTEREMGEPFISHLRYYLNEHQSLQVGVHFCQHTAAAPGVGVPYSLGVHDVWVWEGTVECLLDLLQLPHDSELCQHK
jgi:hypothetical protein